MRKLLLLASVAFVITGATLAESSKTKKKKKCVKSSSCQTVKSCYKDKATTVKL